MREATEAIGHAVRQLYLPPGVTDVYLETGDARCSTAMEALWRSAFDRRPTSPAPTARATATRRSATRTSCRRTAPTRETCAAIASFQWNWRMLLATGDGALRRGDGARALQRDRRRHRARRPPASSTPTRSSCARGTTARTEDAPSERLTWYALRVLPAEPRAARRVAAATTSRPATRTASSCTCYAAGRDRARPRRHARRVTVDTDYPWDGRAEIAVDGPRTSGRSRCASRPGARAPTLTVDGEPVDATPDEQATCGCAAPGRLGAIVLELPMPRPRDRARTRASTPCAAASRSPAARSCTASSRPTTTGVELEDLRVDPASPPQPGRRRRRARRAGDARGARDRAAGRRRPAVRPHAAEPPAGRRGADGHPLLPLGQPGAERHARLDPEPERPPTSWRETGAYQDHWRRSPC